MPKAFPKEFRADVIRVYRESDASMAEVAKDFGISPSCLKRWLAIDDRESLSKPAVSGPGGGSRRRRSNNEGKHDPDRSFGIRNSRSPAVVVRTRDRLPLRCAVRSGLRFQGSAPVTLVSSASINGW